MKESFCKDVKSYFKQYCTHSTVHGFQYFGEKRRTISERIWWITVFLTCLSGCGYAIKEVYLKWDQSPVIVNFANSGTPIYKVPFPAVTICPESKVDETVFDYMKIKTQFKDGKIDTLSNEKRRLYDYTSLLCDQLSDSNFNITVDPEDFYESIEKIRPKFTITKCSYFNEDCKNDFIPVITDEGYCYTFNMLNREDIFRNETIHYRNFLQHNTTANWTLTNGYEDNRLDIYPRRAYLAGARNGLRLQLATPKDGKNYACKKLVKGYKVILHTPTTIPRPGQKYFRISQDKNIVAAVQPIIITTSNRVTKYDAKKRKCYFGKNERELSYFKEYTSSNCRVECLTNYTLHFCGCVSYYMPRKADTPICGTQHIKCVRDAERTMQKYELNASFHMKDSKINAIKENNLNCDCMAICSDLTYEAYTTEVDWDVSPSKKNNFLYLTLYFKSDDFLTSERNELYGPIDFLANFGGLLGLFTGFSILSLMEIIYFLTIRIITNIQIYGKWTGPVK